MKWQVLFVRQHHCPCSVVVLSTRGPVWQSVTRLLRWSHPWFFSLAWPLGEGDSFRCQIFRTRPKICFLDHLSAARSVGRLVGKSEIPHGHAIWASQSSFISSRVSYSDLSAWRWKSALFLPDPAVTWGFCLNDFSLWECMLYECVTMTNHCIYAQGVGVGGCCKSPTEFNWLVSAKCGRGLTSMFRSASWVGRCKMIHQLSGKEHTALLLCCPLLSRLCSSALDGIFASSGPCVSL